ncbi:HAD-IA family hydrolase [Actinomycetes bacterium KLBMP 9797]
MPLRSRPTALLVDISVIKASLMSLEQHEGRLDLEVLEFVREARAAGVPVGIAANGTEQLEADLDVLGLAGEVDAIVNSWRIQAHKPSKEFFAAACQALGVPPGQVLFVDDSDRMVRGARAAGLPAYRWTGPDDLRYLRRALLA